MKQVIEVSDMNDIDKKRQQIASVNEHIESISEQDFEQMSEQSIEAVKEQIEFDRQLKRALNVPVPEGLEERIILNNATQQRSSRFSYFAIAASITLVLSLGLFLPLGPSGTLSAQALEHVHHEEKYLTLDNQVTTEQLQARLDKMGFKLAQLPKEVILATRCGLGGEDSMHIIAEIDGKPVTLFITKLTEPGTVEFNDNFLVGKMRAGLNANLIVIAEEMQLVDRFMEQIGGV
ncbi:MAG: DUF3379 domain-containing protein [Kangiellaceae bacterium]|nr:DUF3379 domain-containing protein [Kangiellaceae bacterium]MCW8998141.1 DUF3379 domain-containing protein [Kangiellaceae bacterium]MCW9016493.1 DUF3379 domain-containing protein [Kangiellaceae bacterium]